MSWTTPKTWQLNEILTSSDMNTYVSDNTNYLYGRRVDATLITWELANNTGYTNFIRDAWRTVPITNEYGDADGNVTIDTANDRFTLAAGTYVIMAGLGFAATTRRALRIYNHTDSVVSGVNQGLAHSSEAGMTLTTIITIGGSKTFEVQVYPNGADFSANHLAHTVNSGGNEHWMHCTIIKISD